MNNKKTILICPLEWGLGHASRMIPVAAELIERGHKVLFASGTEHLNLIRSELPECELIVFSGFKPRYSKYLPQYIWLLFKIPSLIYHIFSEHFRLKKIIKKHSIDIIISDNRFGLWNSEITSVYVTHMPRIPFPAGFRFLEPVGILIHRQIIKKYDWLFIPDMPTEPNLSGRLSHGLKLPDNTRYVGILSRFSKNSIATNKQSDKSHNLIILSGPEPQKAMLKKKLTKIFKNKPTTTIMLGGAPDADIKKESAHNIIFYNHLPSQETFNLIINGKSIITRSGYSTIMDLVAIGCSALLIPTRGQPEQEYLAERLAKQGLFYSTEQRKLNDKTPVPENIIKNTKHITDESSVLLNSALDEVLNQTKKNAQNDKAE